MAYCTIEDLKRLIPEEELAQLADDENLAPVAIDPRDARCAAIIARLEQAIAQADADIDAYLSGRYAVPLSPAPAVARKLSADIAVYNLYSRRLETIPETRSERYKNAVRMLDGIAKGTISIGAAETPEPAGDAGGPEATRAAADRIFTKTTMEGF